MDNTKTGRLIYKLRKEKNMTQRELADMLNVSDKAVSKWERGMGCPDVSLLTEISHVFGIEIKKLLEGELGEKDILGGNMKRTEFYVCPVCGNVIAAMAEADIYCCGKKLETQKPKKAGEGEELHVEIIENDYFITGSHEMTKEHYITFVALLTGDGLMLRKLYPQWDLQTRIPNVGRGRLIWNCKKDGLYYMDLMIVKGQKHKII